MLDVSPGDTLYTNDYIELRVAVNVRAYVYVVQWFPNGNLTVLFPSRGDVALDPYIPTRIPPAPNDWYQLDEEVGTETVYVIAARAPISGIDEALGKEIGAIREASIATAPVPEPAAPVRRRQTPEGAVSVSPLPSRSARPTRMLTMMNRGLRKVVDLDGRSMVDAAARSKEDRIVVASFSFQHAH
jgi:hypothetical protein